MRVPLLDLRAQYATIRRDVERAVAELLESQQFVLGPAVERFEREIAEYTGAPHAVGVASGSDALLLALLALGVGPGDAVVTTPFTFFATASAVARAGARIVFADIDAQSFNLSAETVERALAGPRRPAGRWALLPVHLYGRVAPMESLGALARRYDAPIVEDGAQSIGARAEVGGCVRSAGTIGRIGCLSFFPSKNLGGAGDGGMALTADAGLAERLRMLRVHGSRRRYQHDVVGLNSRLDAIQAAILSVKLRRLDDWNRRRRERAALYARRFRECGLAPGPVVPPAEAGAAHVFHQYVIRVERRDELRAALGDAGVETQVYYPVPLHLQPCFADLGHRAGDFPASEQASRECLALPIYPELSDEAIDYVVETIAGFFGSRR